MLLPELQRIAQSEGITGTAKMRKGQLIAAIEERRQGGGQGSSAARRRFRAEHRRTMSQGHSQDFRQLSPAESACGSRR